MAARKKIFLLISVCIFLIDAVFVTMVFFSAERTLQSDIERRGAELESAFRLGLKTVEASMVQIATLIAAEPAVQQLFLEGARAVAREGGGAGGAEAAKFRARLLELVKPRWDDATEKFDVRQLHFHLGPGDVSFLRVHRPEKFGDDLSSVRHTITAVDKTKMPSSGFETGRVVSGIRGAVPVFAGTNGNADRNYVGVLESGTSFEALLRTLGRQFGADFAVLLYREHLEASVWPEFLDKIFENNPLVRDLYVEASLDPGIKDLLRQDAVYALGRGRGTVRIGSEQGWLGVTSSPFRDFLGTRDPTRADVGSLMIWYDVSALVGAFERDAKVNIAYGIGGFLAIELMLFGGLRSATRRLETTIDDRTAELRQSHNLLEKRVEERTADLSASNKTLQDSEQRFRDFLDHAPAAISVRDLDSRHLLVNNRFEELVGAKGEAIVGRRCQDLFPEDFVRDGERHDREVIERKRAIQWRAVLAIAGPERIFEITQFPILDAEHRVLATGSIFTDVTDQETVEAQLYQAQKMEAIGTLAGGIAHDFNNFLTVIIGNLELIQNDGAISDELGKLVRPALSAAERGADLVERLLSFSRKEPLVREPVNMSRLVTEMLEILRGALGTRYRIETNLPADVWDTLCNQTQIGTGLLNLAMNARDAMPDGGTLTVETANLRFEPSDTARLGTLEAGDYVMLAVSDTGSGMSGEAVARAFEPFFTTKEVGKGTGLGLSMIYGFVKRSGGHAEIDSAPGKGTTVRLYLPRVAPEAEDAV